MPSRNVIKIDSENSYYHIYARGHSKQVIFFDKQDYLTFTNLFKRYLGSKQEFDRAGVTYPNFGGKLDLVCFCLMRNHFHLLVYQHEKGTMAKFMKSLSTSYVRYFNNKYQRSGALFESRYKASLIYDQSYLEHISRYIHLNRKNWKNSPYTSINYFIYNYKVDWIDPSPILEMFSSREDYGQFVADYKANQNMLDELKYELANYIIS